MIFSPAVSLTSRYIPKQARDTRSDVTLVLGNLNKRLNYDPKCNRIYGTQTCIDT